ncbi:MAG: tagaturonate reductase, partial [Bacillota bacterium]
FLAYYKQTGSLPAHLTFSLAALMALYRGSEIKNGALICERNGVPYQILDDETVLKFFAEHSSLTAQEQTVLFLQNASFWGQDLSGIPGLMQTVARTLEDMKRSGMLEALHHRFPN